MNSTALFNTQTQNDDVSSDFLFDLYEKSRNNFGRSRPVEGDERNSTQRSNDCTVNSNSLTEMLSQIVNVADDNTLSDLLQLVSERAKELEK